MPKVLQTSTQIDTTCNLADFFKILKTKDAIDRLKNDVFYSENYLNQCDSQGKLPLEYAASNEPLKQYLIAQGADISLVYEKEFNLLYQQYVSRLWQVLPPIHAQRMIKENLSPIKEVVVSDEHSPTEKLAALSHLMRSSQNQESLIPKVGIDIGIDFAQLSTLLVGGYIFFAAASCLKESQFQPSAFVNNLTSFLSAKCVFASLGAAATGALSLFMLLPERNSAMSQLRGYRALGQLAKVGYDYVVYKEKIQAMKKSTQPRPK